MDEDGVGTNSLLLSSTTPVIGMKFKSEEDAYLFYNSYARALGFSIRKHYKSKCKKDNKLLWRVFCCSCQGEREKHPNGTPNKPRAQTRFNCQAQMRIDLENSTENYVVSMFIKEHSHVLADPSKVHVLRSHRKISAAQRCLISNMSESGIGSSEIYYHCSKEAGGFEHLGFTQSDCDNVVQRRRIEFLKKGDGQLLLDYFRNKKKENKSFFYRFQLSEDTNQISNCFWCDAKSRIDYQCFGDVLCFDTTYKTNEYDMPFAPFVGVNNHRQTIIFAGALLSDERAETFVWLFETFLEAMGGKVMETIFTDQAPSIVKAIRQVFPSSHHRLCIWHIYQNALRNLSHVFSAFESFRLDFTKCIYEAEIEEDFLMSWNNLLETYNLKENGWLQNLFELRFKWAQVYAREYFCAGMASTQRSESINNYFKKYFKRKQILREFMDQYDRAVSLRRQKEANADVKSKTTTPNLFSRWPVERYASEFYTQKMFRYFQEELKRAFDMEANVVIETSTEYTYHVSSYNGGRIRKVEVSLPSLLVKCSCKRFEFTGILCAHILKVLRMRNVLDLSAQYFLKRWSKDAKPEVIIDTGGNTIVANPNVALTVRYSALSNLAQDVVKEGSMSEELAEIARSGLKRVLDELKSSQQYLQGDVEYTNDISTQNHDQESGAIDDLGVNITLEAPPRKKLQNQTSGRIKGFYDTMKKKGKPKPQRRKKVTGQTRQGLRSQLMPENMQYQSQENNEAQTEIDRLLDDPNTSLSQLLEQVSNTQGYSQPPMHNSIESRYGVRGFAQYSQSFGSSSQPPLGSNSFAPRNTFEYHQSSTNFPSNLQSEVGSSSSRQVLLNHQPLLAQLLQQQSSVSPQSSVMSRDFGPSSLNQRFLQRLQQQPRNPSSQSSYVNRELAQDEHYGRSQLSPRRQLDFADDNATRR